MKNSIDPPPAPLWFAILVILLTFLGILSMFLVMNAYAAPLTQMEPRWVCTAFPICWVTLNDAPDVWTAVLFDTKIEWWLVVERWNADTDWRYETRG